VHKLKLHAKPCYAILSTTLWKLDYLIRNYSQFVPPHPRDTQRVRRADPDLLWRSANSKSSKKLSCVVLSTAAAVRVLLTLFIASLALWQASAVSRTQAAMDGARPMPPRQWMMHE
jgi:hypothetical protein